MCKKHILFLKQKIELDGTGYKVEDQRRNERETHQLVEIENLKNTVLKLNEMVSTLEREKTNFLKDLSLNK